MQDNHLIKYLTIKGFKSIQNLDRLPLSDLNILIGANGSGKSNFISYFQMLSELVEMRLQRWVVKQGGAERIFSFGVKETNELQSIIEFGAHSAYYEFSLEPTNQENLIFKKEVVHYPAHDPNFTDSFLLLSPGYFESELKIDKAEKPISTYKIIAGWKVYHFHDTSELAGVKRLSAVHDNEYLREDASNLAAFLYRLRNEYSDVYQQIRKVIQLVLPFFDDFVLKPQTLPSEEQQVRLLWRQKDSDYPFWPSQLSDGSIRLICLVTALLQPEPPSTILIDEPELGLHPYAITLLASLLKVASKRMQVIVSTQSVPLVNEFTPEDLIIVEREHDNSVFKRLNSKDLSLWLEEYSLGELWENNILGGRPPK